MTAGEIVVRPARADEREAIVRLTRDAYGEYADIMSPSGWEGLRDSIWGALERWEPAERFVAELGGRLVGSVALYPAEAGAYGESLGAIGWPEVRLMAVERAARGRGVAKALLAACVEAARAAGHRAIGLHSSESMRAALAIYAQLGFERAPEVDFQPPGAELVMGFRKNLD